MPDQLKDGETLEPLGAKPAAQPSAGLKAGETIEPIQRGSSAAGLADEEQPASSRFLQGVKRGALNILHGVKEVGSDLISRPTPVFTGEDSMLNKYILGPAAHEKERSILEAAAMHDSHGAESVGHGLTSMIHTAGEFVAGIGPMVGSLVDRAREGDIAGSVGEGATYALAPKVARGVGAKAIDVVRDVPGVRTLIPSTEGLGKAIGSSPTAGPILEKAINRVSPAKTVFPGAPLPENPGVFPGAPLPEHPGVFPGAPLPEKPPVSILQAASPNRLPATGAVPAAESGEALGAIPSAKPAEAIPINVKPQHLQDLIQEGTGGQPLKPNVPLRDQAIKINSTEAPVAHRNPMEAAHGKAIFEATRAEPETMKAIHELTRVDLRQALINSGEDMGQKIVTNSKFAGGEGITREEAFNLLLKKGYSPKQIVGLAKRPIAEPAKSTPASVAKTPSVRSVIPTAAASSSGEDLTGIRQQSLDSVNAANTSRSILGGEASGTPSILQAAKRSLISKSKKEVSEIGKQRGIDLTGGNDPSGTGALSAKGTAIDAILNDLSPEELAGR